MRRNTSLTVALVLTVGCLLSGPSAKAHAQSFAGKWVHAGPKGTSVLDFYPGDRRLLGPMKGGFHHSIVLDDGRVVVGDGYYVFRSIGPNRGWLTLHFSDGHVTREHEHTIGGAVLNLRHHGIIRNYTRQ